MKKIIALFILLLGCSGNGGSGQTTFNRVLDSGVDSSSLIDAGFDKNNNSDGAGGGSEGINNIRETCNPIGTWKISKEGNNSCIDWSGSKIIVISSSIVEYDDGEKTAPVVFNKSECTISFSESYEITRPYGPGISVCTENGSFTLRVEDDFLSGVVVWSVRLSEPNGVHEFENFQSVSGSRLL